MPSRHTLRTTPTPRAATKQPVAGRDERASTGYMTTERDQPDPTEGAGPDPDITTDPDGTPKENPSG